MLRILFLGENWFGSCARACCFALRRMGHDVSDIDAQTFFPQLRRLSSRGLRRIYERRLITEYNDQILATVSIFAPDILLAFKGQYVLAETLVALRKNDVTLYNYYPDTSSFAHGGLLPKSLPEYDCVFWTKKFLESDVHKGSTVRRSVFLPHGYDQELHKPWPLEERDWEQYSHDVGFIATHTRRKEELLESLVERLPNIDLRIWGNGWVGRNRSSKLKAFIQGAPLNGSSYAKALRAFRINLAIMSGAVEGASQGDETTTRTYEIPACGGFMLHERTDEVQELFEENKELACFGHEEELAEKIEYYLAHPEERARIAAAGYARCVPAYSYDNRMADIIRWHEKHSA